VTTTSALGTAVAKQRNLYAEVTGYPTKTQTIDTSNNVVASILRTFDALGRPTTYTDADGNTSTITYDLISRASTINDGKATQTYAYNGGNEKRGLPTQLVDGQVGTIAATYDLDGNVATETRPDGLTVRHFYNENSQATGLEYVTTPSCSTASCTLYYDYNGSDTHGRVRLDASSFSNSGYGYDNAGRLTGHARKPRWDARCAPTSSTAAATGPSSSATVPTPAAHARTATRPPPEPGPTTAQTASPTPATPTAPWAGL
jgi:YD repeat-containing protein